MIHDSGSISIDLEYSQVNIILGSHKYPFHIEEMKDLISVENGLYVLWNNLDGL